MTRIFENAGVLEEEFLESGMQSLVAVSKATQLIVTEATDYTKASFDNGSMALERLFNAGTLETVFAIQTDFVKKTYEGLVSEASKLCGLYADLAKETYRPFESVIVKAK